jgi:predicted AlkP superfamily phosphohydrolase/phosphomutase
VKRNSWIKTLFRSSIRRDISAILILTALCQTVFLQSAQAYIGPGAGFAVAGSGFSLLLSLLGAVLALIFWPVRSLIHTVRTRDIRKRRRTRRVIIAGFDGMEPTIVDELLGRKLLPNFQALAESGSYSRLGTTLPPLSPVAWTTFQTGVNPGAHNIYDFVSREKSSYAPQLSSAKTLSDRKQIRFAGLSFSLPRTRIVSLRKSKPFWKILAEQGIPSSILRVPISYPAEPFSGTLLSAMCTPDLKGTQGSFTLFRTGSSESGAFENGEVRSLTRVSPGSSMVWSGELEGPEDPRNLGSSPLRLPFRLHSDTSQEFRLNIAGQELRLTPRRFSSWVSVPFSYGPGRKIWGLVQFCLIAQEPEISLYASPVNVHPLHPCLPISWPRIFAPYLNRRIGDFGTLGFLEDTWARNENFLDDELFLEQAYSVQAEREKMFLAALDTTPEGCCACVFDSSDRVQHIFWRHRDAGHPAAVPEGTAHAGAIEELYIHLDTFLGRLREQLSPDDVLIVLSDHGFTSFRRCVDLNAWLLENGYLFLKQEQPNGYLQNIDWNKTRAYALGLSGLYLNLQGRERSGIVTAEEAPALKQDLIKRLQLVSDPQGNRRPIRRVYEATQAYRGLYVENAPDLIIGYEPGYRVSWESAKGGVGREIISDNTKAWSGDHCADPPTLPGILLSNQQLKVSNPDIIDLPSTILSLLGCTVPEYMEGRIIF